MSRPEKIVRECAKCGVKFMAEKEGGEMRKERCPKCGSKKSFMNPQRNAEFVVMNGL